MTGLRILSALAVLLVAPAKAQQTDLSQYIPESSPVEADVMIIGAPPEIEALAEKMKVAAQANPAWFQAYVTQNQGQVMPYHENLGVTEEEYQQFLEYSESGMALRKATTIRLDIQTGDDGAIAFVTEPSNFPLNGVKIAGDGLMTESPFGRLRRVIDIEQENAGSPTGRWSGPRWGLQERNSDISRRIQFAIGKRDDFGDGIIYYDVFYQGSPQNMRFSFIILFPLQ